MQRYLKLWRGVYLRPEGRIHVLSLKESVSLSDQPDKDLTNPPISRFAQIKELYYQLSVFIKAFSSSATFGTMNIIDLDYLKSCMLKINRKYIRRLAYCYYAAEASLY